MLTRCCQFDLTTFQEKPWINTCDVTKPRTISATPVSALFQAYCAQQDMSLPCVLQVAEFAQVLQQLPTDCLLAAAFITYLGKEAEDVRQAAVTQWCSDLGATTPWSLTALLASETELLTWKSQGGPCSLHVIATLLHMQKAVSCSSLAVGACQ